MKHGPRESRPACVASCWRRVQLSDCAVGAGVGPLTASFCHPAHSKHAHGKTTKARLAAQMLCSGSQDITASLHHFAYASALRLCRQQAWGLLKGSCRITASGSALSAAVLPDSCTMLLHPSPLAPHCQQCSQMRHHQRAICKRGTQQASDRSPCPPRAAHSRGQKPSQHQQSMQATCISSHTAASMSKLTQPQAQAWSHREGKALLEHPQREHSAAGWPLVTQLSRPRLSCLRVLGRLITFRQLQSDILSSHSPVMTQLSLPCLRRLSTCMQHGKDSRNPQSPLPRRSMAQCQVSHPQCQLVPQEPHSATALRCLLHRQRAISSVMMYMLTINLGAWAAEQMTASRLPAMQTLICCAGVTQVLISLSSCQVAILPMQLLVTAFLTMLLTLQILRPFRHAHRSLQKPA